MTAPTTGDPAPEGAWQADLLAFGQARLERWTGRLRYRHLYPEGPNYALLVAALQALDRRVATGCLAPDPRRLRRCLARDLRRRLEADAACREAHVSSRIPPPLRHPIPTTLPPAAARALEKVDGDVRHDVAAWVTQARVRPPPASDQSMIDPRHTQARFERGRAQFREALYYEIAKDPASVGRIHPELLAALVPPTPPRTTHPVAVAVLLEAPLYLWMTLVVLFNVLYLAAFVFFNDAVLGRFVSTQVSSILQGDLEIREIHWRPRLIVDFLLGRPTPLIARGVSIYEPYKDFVDERGRKAVVADEVHLSMTLHEIVPWTRLGVPAFFDVPWILHFSDVRIESPVTFWIRRYPTRTTAGEDTVVLGLRDAFRLHGLSPDPNRRGLSVRLDDARLDRVLVEVDDAPLGGWRAAVDARDAEIWIDFAAPPPGEDDTGPIPFRFHVSATPTRGLLEIAGRRFPLGKGTRLALDAGHGTVDDGDVAVALEAPAASSPVLLTGRLRNVFRYDEALTTAEVTLETPDAGGLARQVLRQLGLDDHRFVAAGRPARATLVGPLSAPDMFLDLEAASADLFDEPAWVATNVRARILAHRRGVAPELRTPAVGPDATRWQFLFGALEARVLGGKVRLRSVPASVVLPELPDEPWVIDADLTLVDVDPAGLVPSQPELARSLAGRASGGLGVRLEILSSQGSTADAPADEEGGETSIAARLAFDDVRLRRRLGPAADGLPRNLALAGALSIDHDGAIEANALRLATSGGRAIVSGTLLPGARRVEGGDLDVEVGDGDAFSRAFAWPAVFERAHAALTFSGPPARLSGPPGSFAASGIGLPGSPGGAIPDARLWIERGTLKLRAPRGRLLGGTGRVDVDLQLARRGQLLDTPRIRATVDLDGIDLASLLGQDVAGAADLRLEVADDRGAPVPLDALEARAALFSPRVSIQGHTFSGAEAQLRLTPKTLDIERLVLPFHRTISPFHAPQVTVPVGRVQVRGRVGLEAPHPLDLEVDAGGVPLGLLTTLFLERSPVYAAIAEGTHLTVRGDAERPSLEGTVRVMGVHAAGIDLGAGELRIDSSDVAAAGPLAAHRELRVEGDLATADRSVQSRIDGVVAIGNDGRVDAEGAIYFDRMTVDHVLRSLEGPSAGLPGVVAGVEGLSADLRACAGRRPMLSVCTESSGREPSVRADLSAERIFVAARTGKASPTADPCRRPDALCSRTTVRATVDGDLIRLQGPVELRTAAGRAISVSGSFDLAPPPGERSVCRAPGTPDRAPVGGRGHAVVRGVVDLRPLAALLADGLDVTGSVAVDLSVDGHLFDPVLTGAIRRTGADRPIEVRLEGLPAVAVERVEIRPEGDDLRLALEGRIGGHAFRVLDAPGRRSYLTYRGPCAGAYAASLEGALPAEILAPLLPRGWRLRGAVQVASAHVEGRAGAKVPVRRAEATFAFRGAAPLELDADLGLETIRVRRGTVAARYCATAPCPPGLAPGRADVLLGGVDAAEAGRAPAEAVAAEVGPRGRAVLWGRLAYDTTVDELSDARLRATLRDVTVRTYDGQGRAELVATLSSQDLRLVGAAPPLLRGTIALDDARWVKNALENVGLLSFLGEGSGGPEAPTPAAIRDLGLDLEVATAAPLRVENNIAEGVEARFEVHVGGTYDAPEFEGRMDLEPGGVVRLPFVGGSFEIQEGRVTLERDIEDAVVDVLTERREPIYVDGQPRRFTLRLAGPLRAIRWECDAGIVDRNRAVDAATDECVDYLLLGAGDVPNSANVQGNASSGLLYARKGMNVVGNVAEVDVTRQVDRAVPRLSPYLPDVRLRLGQLGPEIDVRTPREWFDFDYGHATVGFGFTRGYPGFLLRSNREFSLRLRLLDAFTIEARRSRRSYLNERVVFDPLEQGVFEATFDFEIPSLR